MMNNTYPDGKARLYQWLINHIPPHDTYIATHLGHDAILRFKRPARSNIGIDVDAQVIAWWMQTNPPPPMDGSGLYRQIGGYLPAFTFIHGDAHDWLRRYAWTGGEFVYSDPPYLFHTRQQKERPLYTYEYTISQHIDLLLILKSLPCPVMLSGYPSDLYDDLLSGWRKDTIRTTTRAGRPATEVIWMNYDPSNDLHDYRWLGDTYRERERIKKLKQRWTKRWQAMDRLQRQAILAAIQETNTPVTQQESTR
jgi:DNA adenine methylase